MVTSIIWSLSIKSMRFPVPIENDIEMKTQHFWEAFIPGGVSRYDSVHF